MSRSRAGVRAWRLATSCLLALLNLACERGSDPLAGRLHELVAAGHFGVGRAAAPAVRFAQPPQLDEVGAAGERRQAVITSTGSWWWRGQVPAGARLAGAVQVLPPDAPAGGAALAKPADEPRVAVTVTALRPLEREVLAEIAGDGGWLPLAADLSHLAGQQVELQVEARVQGGAAGARVAWAPFQIAAAAGDDRRPNIVVVLVDTLRADRLVAYGNERPTSPNLQALLADRGVVVERAYAQAPWTIPSVVSLMASRWPGEVLGEDVAAYRLPGDAPVLASALQGLGYETAAFLGNPSLHAGNGFTRGFATAYAPPNFHQAMEQEHAGRITGLARSWLQSHRSRPFFLYLHYVDPHDPYDNPEIRQGKSPFYRQYKGTLSGLWMQGIFLGKIPLESPAEDVRHLGALYDSEIHWFDRTLPDLFDAFDAETLRNTLFVFTSDHGEELYEHGGWKHGRTLYEEQLRIPLVLRWDGHLPAKTRVQGPVRLLDVAPTLLRAAGAVPPAGWQGRDLLPLLTGKERDGAPGEPLFAQHLVDGPLRAAAIAGPWKLILFDRDVPFQPADAYQRALYDLEMKRLARVELYDLRRDPGEQHNLAAERPAVVRQLAPVIYEHLGRRQAGLRVLLSGAPVGQRVEVSMRLSAPVAGWTSCFLGKDDRALLAGDRLTLSLVGEALPKGVRLPIEAGTISDLVVSTGAATPVSVRLGGGGVWAGGPLPLAATLHRGWPAGAPAGAELLLWTATGGGAPGPAPVADPETLKRLQALGYVG